MCLARTHRPAAALSWPLLAFTLPIPHEGAMGLLALAAGSATAWVTSGGWTSPDVDRLWAPSTAGLHHWAHHRGWTHRLWFFAVLCATAWWVITSGHFPSPGWVLLAALWGWLTHLCLDMAFGQLRVLGKDIGFTLDTGGWTEDGLDVVLRSRIVHVAVAALAVASVVAVGPANAIRSALPHLPDTISGPVR